MKRAVWLLEAEKNPGHGPGLESLIAVITLRLLLREEKQGTTTSRLSSKINLSRYSPSIVASKVPKKLIVCHLIAVT